MLRISEHEAEKEECRNREDADDSMNVNRGGELTDNVVVMRFGIIDNAGRFAEVIMIEQRSQQDCDRDRYVAPHAFP